MCFCTGYGQCRGLAEVLRQLRRAVSAGTFVVIALSPGGGGCFCRSVLQRAFSKVRNPEVNTDGLPIVDGS